jgi:hypothetical protein
MDGLDYWRLCDELTIVQAALLIAGEDPGQCAEYAEGWSPENRPDGYEAAKNAISTALRRNDLEGELVPIYTQNPDGNSWEKVDGSIDVAASRVSVDSLRKRLRLRGFNTGFFFPEGTDAPEYLDPSNARYAPKLAAAVQAWQAMDDESLQSGKSPKQALTKWLREHASDFGLSDDEGKPNETGIEEVAKVANWRLTGGAPKTPVG